MQVLQWPQADCKLVAFKTGTAVTNKTDLLGISQIKKNGNSASIKRKLSAWIIHFSFLHCFSYIGFRRIKIKGIFNQIYLCEFVLQQILASSNTSSASRRAKTQQLWVCCLVSIYGLTLVRQRGSPSGSVSLPPYITGSSSASMYFSKISCQFAINQRNNSMHFIGKAEVSYLRWIWYLDEIFSKVRCSDAQCLTPENMDLLSCVLAQKVLDKVVGNRKEFGGCRRKT